MTTHAALPLPRRPFAALDGSRLRNLQNTKNRQNAVPTTLSPPMKRRYAPSDDAVEDAENIDPSLTSPKRVKNMDACDMTSSTWAFAPSQEPHFILTDAPPSPDAALTSPVKPSSAPAIKRSLAKVTPRLKRAGGVGGGSPHARPVAGASKGASPAAVTSPTTAGRSPKSKRIGILNRRRTASPFTRIDPPGKKLGVSPLSLDAALSGTISNYNVRTRAVPAPASPPARRPTGLDVPPMKDGWFFQIHEDTQDEMLTNLMEFSTGVLDISDDEDRRREKDDRGKENIPPDAEFHVAEQQATSTTASRPASEPAALSAASSLLKERGDSYAKRTINPLGRAPLADLPPADFYDASPLNGTSFTLEIPSKSNDAITVVDSIDALLDASRVGTVEAKVSSEEVVQPTGGLDLGHPEEVVQPTGGLDLGGHPEEVQEKDIQIWESESAAGEAAAVALD